MHHEETFAIETTCADDNIGDNNSRQNVWLVLMILSISSSNNNNKKNTVAGTCKPKLFELTLAYPAPTIALHSII